MTKLDRIIEAIEDMTPEEQVQIHNAYCESCNCPDNYIYPNTEESMNEIFDGSSPWEIVSNICEWNSSDEYMWFNGNGHLVSDYGCYLIDHQIFPSDIADDAVRKNDDFGSDEIREILDDEEECE